MLSSQVFAAISLMRFPILFQLNARRMTFARTESEEQIINTSQLHQSRLGLLSQALMMMVITGFLFLEVYETVWSTQ